MTHEEKCQEFQVSGLLGSVIDYGSWALYFYGPWWTITNGIGARYNLVDRNYEEAFDKIDNLAMGASRDEVKAAARPYVDLIERRPPLDPPPRGDILAIELVLARTEF